MTDITLLDGGMGQELILRSGKPASPLWSTQVMIDRPGLVGEVHSDYADAGATVATTNSYALHRDRLRGGASNHYADDGVDLPNMEGELHSLLAAATAEADVVRDRSRIAGSIGPLGASYRADIHPDFDEAVPLYAEIAEALAPKVDVLLFETIPSVNAAKACLAAGLETNVPVWLAFTVDDENGGFLRSGEPVAEALAIAGDASALLINCSAPEAIAASLKVLSTSGKPYGAFANGFQMLTKDFIQGGTTADGLKARQDLTPDIYADYALSWVDAGATIVGGCCEVGPAHIKAIRDRILAAGHSIV